jgi:hypothetical protein
LCLGLLTRIYAIEKVQYLSDLDRKLHPVAKAVLASINVIYQVPISSRSISNGSLIYVQRLEEQEQNNDPIIQLADDMASIIPYIEDVEQFARISQLRKAIEDIFPLIEDTKNFILRYTSRSGTSTAIVLSLNILVLTYSKATVKEPIFSSADHTLIQDLEVRFQKFKQQFDRGVSVQSALNLEALAKEIGV